MPPSDSAEPRRARSRRSRRRVRRPSLRTIEQAVRAAERAAGAAEEAVAAAQEPAPRPVTNSSADSRRADALAAADAALRSAKERVRQARRLRTLAVRAAEELDADADTAREQQLVDRMGAHRDRIRELAEGAEVDAAAAQEATDAVRECARRADAEAAGRLGELRAARDRVAACLEATAGLRAEARARLAWFDEARPVLDAAESAETDLFEDDRGRVVAAAESLERARRRGRRLLGQVDRLTASAEDAVDLKRLADRLDRHDRTLGELERDLDDARRTIADATDEAEGCQGTALAHLRRRGDAVRADAHRAVHAAALAAQEGRAAAQRAVTAAASPPGAVTDVSAVAPSLHDAWERRTALLDEVLVIAEGQLGDAEMVAEIRGRIEEVAAEGTRSVALHAAIERRASDLLRACDVTAAEMRRLQRTLEEGIQRCRQELAGLDDLLPTAATPSPLPLEEAALRLEEETARVRSLARGAGDTLALVTSNHAEVLSIIAAAHEAVDLVALAADVDRRGWAARLDVALSGLAQRSAAHLADAERRAARAAADARAVSGRHAERARHRPTPAGDLRSQPHAPPTRPAPTTPTAPARRPTSSVTAAAPARRPGAPAATAVAPERKRPHRRRTRRRPALPARPRWPDRLRDRGVRPLDAMGALVVAVALAAAVARPELAVVVLVLLVAVWIARSVEFATGVLCVFTAALLVIPSRFTAGPFALTAASLIALLAALSWGAGKATRAERLATGVRPIPLVVGGFFVVALASYAAGHVRGLTAAEAAGADRSLAALVVLVGLCLFAADALRTRRQIDRVTGMVAVAGGAMAAVGIVQFTLGINLWQDIAIPGLRSEGHLNFIYGQRGGFQRVAGTARHPIEFGIACAAVLPVALHVARHALNRNLRRVAAVSSVLLFAAIPMALSRAAILALVVAAVVLLPRWTWGMRVAATSVVVGLTLAAALTFPGLGEALGDMFFETEDDGSITSRRVAIEEALPLGEAGPLLGRGYGTWNLTDGFLLDNQYTRTLLEMGYVGTGALAALLGAGLAMGLRAGRRHPDPAMRDLAASLAATVGGIGIAGFGLEVLWYPITSGLLFLALGVLTVVERQAASEAADDAVSPSAGGVPPPPHAGARPGEPHLVGSRAG